MPIIVFLLISILIVLSVIFRPNEYETGEFSYESALNYALMFYDANKCGQNAKNDNYFPWIQNCHLKDGIYPNIDLTGGYHNAGSSSKFTITQAYSATIIGWGYIDCQKSFQTEEINTRTQNLLKNFSDYFMKCYIKEDTFVYQIGDEASESEYIKNPAKTDVIRNITGISDLKKPASEVLGLTSAALSMKGIIEKNKDKEYSKRCINISKKLYKMGKTNQGFAYNNGDYKSESYYDDLAWAAIWLYYAENNRTYISEAEKFLEKAETDGEKIYKNNKTANWNDMYLPVFIKLAEIKKSDKYLEAAKYTLNYWENGYDTTTGGLKYFADDGALSYAVSESATALMYDKKFNTNRYTNFARTQADYILGKNPNNMSYMVGFGTKWPKHPSFRMINQEASYKSNTKNLVRGALVSGPDKNDKFKDEFDLKKYTGVGLEYNANAILLFALISEK